MTDITSREELEAWLKDKPVDWSQVIAVRAALRVIPKILLSTKSDNWMNVYMVDIFQSLFISWLNINNENFKIIINFRYKEDPYFIYGALYNGGSLYEGRLQYEIALAAFEAIIGAADLFSAELEFKPEQRLQATSAVTAAAAANGDEIWGQAQADCRLLLAQNGSQRMPSSLSNYKLWSESGEYTPQSGQWQYAATRLLTLDPTYQVWIDWYDRRIRGERAAFDIPGDSDRTEDKKILARLADATNEDFWGKGATHVNTTLQSWIDEARERVRPRDAPFVTDPLRQLDDELQSLIDEAREQVAIQSKASEPEPQNADVIQFRQTETGQFDPDFSAGSDELLTDQPACDRHCAFVTTARDALSLCRGHNQIGHVAEHLTIVIDAAGDQPRTMRVDLLVARGERMVDDLRDAINELQPDPELALGNLREKRIVNVFSALIRDYTALIKLDPSLDRRQRLPHNDEENASAVSPQQALIFVNSSVTVGAITQSARDVIVEGARGLTEDGDVKDRKKRRFSETVRNLPRAMIGFLWQHRGGIVGSAVAGVSAVSMALITQEAAIRSFFATNPGMLSIIDELVGILRGIGM